MFDPYALAVFVIAGLLLNLTPGPDLLYITARSLAQGWRAGVASTLGISAGCLVHTAMAALGISVLLRASPAAYEVLRLAGAGYLVYLGVQMLRQNAAKTGLAQLPDTPMRRVFWQGFLTNVLNPKVALFFLAFLPQFIDAGASSKPLAFLFLGVVFNLIGSSWNLFTAWSAAQVHRRLKKGGAAAVWLNRTIGGVFVYLGIKLAAAKLS